MILILFRGRNIFFLFSFKLFKMLVLDTQLHILKQVRRVTTIFGICYSMCYALCYRVSEP